MRGLLFLLSLLDIVAGQLDAGVPGISIGDSIFNGSRVCNGTFADANITGVVSFDPAIGNTNSDVSWLATVYHGGNTSTAVQQQTELSLWFSPGTANYTDNADLGFDACYLWVSSATYNTWSRGQNDTGNCVQTLDQNCVDDINNMTQNYAIWLTGSPDGNLTADALPGVCQTLAKNLTQNFPGSCKPFFASDVQVYGSPPALGGPLTGQDSFIKRAQCTITDEPNNNTYALMWSQFGTVDLGVYSIASWFVTPVITAFFPIANENRLVTIANARSFMSCLRPNNVNNGSYVPPPAPAATPIDTSSNATTSSQGNATALLNCANSTSIDCATSGLASSDDGTHNTTGGLSTGATAGIAVGVVLGVLALLALIIFFVFRKRIQEKLAKRKSGKQFAEMDGSSQPTEMEDKSRRGTMDEQYSAISEMRGYNERRVELSAAEKAPIELPAYPTGGGTRPWKE